MSSGNAPGSGGISGRAAIPGAKVPVSDSRRMRRYTAASVLLHLVILFGVILPVTHPEKPIYAEPIYEVALFQNPVPNYQPPKPVHVDPEPSRPAVEPPQEAPKPKETVAVPPDVAKPKPGQKPKPLVEKPTPKPPVKQPVKQPEKDRKPPAKIEDVQKAQPPAGKVPELKTAPPDEPVSLGMVDQKDFKQSYYLDAIRMLLAREWAKTTPPGSVPLRTVVHFVIRRDGTIESPEITGPSASSIHDRAAMAALLRIPKFPPLPDDYPGDRISPTVAFLTGNR